MHIQERNTVIHNQNIPNVFRTRFSVPFHPKARREFLEDNYWTVFGSGSIGMKADELKRKAAAIEQAGFVLYPRAVLAMGFFDTFMRRAGMNDLAISSSKPKELIGRVMAGDFSERELEILESISKFWLDTPLAIRSSAHGDCRGTGIYESMFVLNNADEFSNLRHLANAVKTVLASQFSQDAIAYRKDLSLDDGMAVIIEPVFGKKFEYNRYHDEKEFGFGPLYGGIAYTGTESIEAKAFIAGGLPLRVVRGESVEISESSEDSICSLEAEFDARTMSDDARLNYAKMKLLQEGKFVSLDGTETLRTAYCPEINIPRNSIDYLPMKAWLFPKLKELGRILGKQQYVEFAVIDDNGTPRVAIMQIAEVNPKFDFYTIAESEKTLISTSRGVVGTGQRLCNEIIEIWNPHEIAPASKYNELHKDFAVLYGSRLISSIVSSENELRYSDVNNASVLIAYIDGNHTQSIRSHWGGALDGANKLLLLAEHIDHDRLHASKTKNADGLTIYRIPILVTASERQQKAIVEITE